MRSLLPIPEDPKSEADVERATGTLPRHRQKPRQRRTCLAPDQLQHRRRARLLGHALPRVRQALFSARAKLRRLIRSAHSVVARSEMATEFPLAGSFTTYAARFGDPALGFTIGWNYAFNDAVSTAGDLTAAQVRTRLLFPLPLARQRGCAHAPPLSPGPHRLLDAQVQLAAFPLLALLRRRRQPHPRSSLWRGAPVSLLVLPWHELTVSRTLRAARVLAFAAQDYRHRHLLLPRHRRYALFDLLKPQTFSNSALLRAVNAGGNVDGEYSTSSSSVSRRTEPARR